MEILCHKTLTVDLTAECSSCSMTNSFVTNAVLIKNCELLTSASANLATAQYLDSWLSDLLQSELKMKLLEVEGARAQCSIAGDATVQLIFLWLQRWH